MYKDSLNTRLALAPSTCLNHTYVIKEVLGEGGFGITYRGEDKTTNKRVAIKEYFPSSLATRTEQADAFFLCPFPGKKEDLFLQGRQRFFYEAKVLKEFQHLESIVSVYDVFEENNTAYIVMEYIEGLTLKQYIEENGYLSFAELLPLMTPVIQDLSAVHKKKLIHRDISPDNLILGTDNHLHLIDFGAVSHENITGGKHTVILKSGYAPPEQYLSDSKVGAWTDVYALCATMYFALTGKPPSEAIHRLEQDYLDFPDTLTDLLPWQKAALKKGLHVRMSKRFCNMDELYDAITTAPETEAQITMTGVSLTKEEKQKIRHIRYRLKMPLLFFLLLFLLVGGFSIISFGKSRQTKTTPKNPAALESTPMQTVNPSPEPSSVDAPLSMPKLSGLSLEQAKQVLNNLDDTIYIKTTKIYHNSTKKGYVIFQSVAEGTLFSTGHLPTVLLTVSRGKKPAASQQKNNSKPKESPKSKTTTAPKVTQKPAATSKPEKTQKKPSSDYHMTTEDDDFVTVPFN